MKRRIVITLLTAALTVSLAACGSSASAPAADNNSTAAAEDFMENGTSVDALNKHFGGKGDMAITEKVRKALLATHQWAMADDDYWDDPLVDEAKESEEEFAKAAAEAKDVVLNLSELD